MASSRAIRRGYAAAAFAGALWLGAPARAQQELTGRSISTYRLFDSDDLMTSGYDQIFELGYRRQVSTPLLYQLSFRGEGADGETKVTGSSAHLGERRLEPGAKFVYALPKLQIEGDWNLNETTSISPRFDEVRRLQRFLALLNWQPENAPALTLEGERRELSDSSSAAHQIEDLATEALEYRVGPLTIGQTERYSVFDAKQTEFRRQTNELQGQARYEDTYFDGRLGASAGVIAGWTRIDEQARLDHPVSVPTLVPISRASYVEDDTPAEDRDHPLVGTPALNDGDLSRSTGISLGSDSRSFQNLAADMGRFVALDSFRVSVRDSGGNFLATGGLVRFDVYSSLDGVAWSAVPGGAATTFDPAQSNYEVTFESFPSRFFKLVSFGTSSGECFVTELQAYYHSLFAPLEKSGTNIRFENATAAVTAQPAKWLHFQYDLLYNRFRTKSDDKEASSSTDVQHIASTEIRPIEPLALTVQYRRQDVRQSSRYDLSLEDLLGTLRFDANRNLHMAVEASRDKTVHQAELGTVTTTTVRSYVDARPYPSIEVILDGGVSRQEVDAAGRSRRRFADATGFFQLTDDLKLTIQANIERVDNPGLAVPDAAIAPGKSDRAYGELYWRPGRELALSARLGYTTAGDQSMKLQQYRFEWYPFPGDALSVGTIYDEDFDQNDLSRRFSRVQFVPRWTLNRHAFVELAYASYRSRARARDGTSTATSTRSLFLTLTLTL